MSGDSSSSSAERNRSGIKASGVGSSDFDTTSNKGDSSEREFSDTFDLGAVTQRNQQQPQSKSMRFIRGTGFGTFTSSSFLSLYSLICLTQNVWADDPNEFTYTEQFNQLSLPGQNALASFSIYIAASALLGGLGNLALRYWQSRPKNIADLEAQSGAESKKSINDFYNAVVTHGKLNKTNPQKLLAVFSHLLFAMFNTCYDFTYLDVGTEAIKMLPGYAGALTGANNLAGGTSPSYNWTLNQFFAKQVIKDIFIHYNLIKLARSETFNLKSGNYSLVNITLKICLLATIALAASTPFAALANFDKSLAKWGRFIVSIAIPSAFVVYGTLSALGAKSVVKNFTSAYDTLASFPQPLKALGNTMLSIPHNIKEFAKEFSFLYLGGCCLSKRYLADFAKEYAFPAPATSESTGLLPQAAQDNNNAERKKPEASLDELEEEIAARIRAKKVNLSSQEYMDLIKAVYTECEQKRKASTEKADVSQYGRVYQVQKFLFKSTGQFGLAFILLAYGTAVKDDAITKVIKSLNPNSAIAALTTLVIFWPFIKLVLDSGANAMLTLLKTVKSISELPDYLSTMWEEKDGEKLINCALFPVKVTLFYFALTTAGSAIDLLSNITYMQENKGVYAFGRYASSLGTGLFNSVGAFGLLASFQAAATDYLLHKDVKPTLDCHNRFFGALKNADGFNLEALSELGGSCSTAA